ncbi:MAG: ROK family protein [Mogibacterium sp.]|nr:ROK family protein [Mogibacterium sp.]
MEKKKSFRLNFEGDSNLSLELSANFSLNLSAKPDPDKLYIGVEIGGTKQQLCVGLSDGTILERRTVRLGEVHARDILAWIETNIRELLDVYGEAGGAQEASSGAQGKPGICGIGVGFGGPLELATGRVLMSMHIPGWNDFELRTWFREKFGLSVIVANDTFTGGMGELLAGAGRGSDFLFYTNIGTGIGGGLYIRGKGYDASGFGAAYLGNTFVPDWRGEPGAYTRMELLCSGRNIDLRLREPGYVPESSALFRLCRGDVSKLSAQELGIAAYDQDRFAEEELDRIAESFSIALANMLALSGVTRVVIGGGVAKMGDILIDRIRNRTEELAFIANRGRYEIRISELLDDAVLAGALILAAEGGDRIWKLI